MKNRAVKMSVPTKGRFALKLLLMALVALGIIDDATAVGILDEPLVLIAIIGLCRMIKHEAVYKRHYGGRRR